MALRSLLRASSDITGCRKHAIILLNSRLAKLGKPMKRRELTLLLASTIAFRPNLLQAQQGGRIFKIGHLESSTPSNSPHLLGAFRDRLRELGYVEGQNLFIERRYAEGKEERLPQFAAELVNYGVDVIFARFTPKSGH